MSFIRFWRKKGGEIDQRIEEVHQNTEEAKKLRDKAKKNRKIIEQNKDAFTIGIQKAIEGR